MEKATGWLSPVRAGCAILAGIMIKQMPKVELGKTGETVSRFSLGCMYMGTGLTREASYAALDRFAEAGGDFLDTANCYAWWLGHGEHCGDESERMIGDWMRERRNRQRVFLATKLGARMRDHTRCRDAAGNADWGRVNDHFEGASAATVARAVDDSLRRLGTDYVDLCYVHIDTRTAPLAETLEALDRLVRAGKVRHIACSNFRAWRIEEARQLCERHGWSPFVAVQQQYSYLRPRPGADFGIDLNVDDELSDYLRAHEEVTLVAYSPLLKGIYEDAQKRAAFYNWHLFDTEDSRERLRVLSEMARELGVSNHQLVYAWLLHQKPAVVPLLAATDLPRLDHNLAALEIELSAAQLATLDRAGL